jgi:antitoxin MazE
MIYIVVECISEEFVMKVSKWGNSLAIRLPANEVARLGLKEGDDIEAVLTRKDDAALAERKRKIAKAWEAFEPFRHQFKRPADYKFDREEANSRD